MIKKQTVLLCVLDGWGIAPDGPYNAIARANTPYFDRLLKKCPHAKLETSGPYVGLPEGQMGNSEVGHMHLGAGRILKQILPRIDEAFEKGEIEKSEVFQSFLETARQRPQNHVHLMGLVSPGGVHAHEDHWIKLAKLLSREKIRTSLHLFLDGRDVGPRTALASIKKVREALQDKEGRLLDRLFWGTVSGRYYAMDRDQRWERTKQAYDAMVDKTPEYVFASPEEGIEYFYREGIGDEFIPPFQIETYRPMHPADGLLMTNFRADRARQILMALLDPDFVAFKQSVRLRFALGMSSYSKKLDRLMPALIGPLEVKNHLGAYLASKGLTQLRLAETEKYPHVTYFFNGGREAPLKGEWRQMVPSPKVATYDLKPEMASVELTDLLLQNLAPEHAPDFILINYANADMVGHTGNMEAAIKAVEAVDHALGRILEAIELYRSKHDYHWIITADHGNSELLYDQERKMAHTSHTLNPVPILLYTTKKDPKKLRDGSLKDVAPTILDLMGLDVPAEMSGHSLIER